MSENINELDLYLQSVEKRNQERAERGEIIELEMPSTAVSGLKWRLLPVRPEQYAITGRLPTHLLKKLQSVKRLGAAAMEKALSPDEVEQLGFSAMEFTRDAMLNNLLFPKISLDGSPGTITPEQIDPDDFQFFMQWLLVGGQADADLKSKRAPRKRR